MSSSSPRAEISLKRGSRIVRSSLAQPPAIAAGPARWWALAAVVVALDILTKLAVEALMSYGQVIPLLEFFNLVHTRNTGAAFSFLADAGGWQRYFFIVLALGISAWLALELRKPLPRLQAAAYSLILGGALANAIDRVARGYVVDYLDFHWRGWHWPAFNVADIGISCGAALLLAATALPAGKRLR